jgi:hypothetical protein
LCLKKPVDVPVRVPVCPVRKRLKRPEVREHFLATFSSLFAVVQEEQWGGPPPEIQ